MKRLKWVGCMLGLIPLSGHAQAESQREESAAKDNEKPLWYQSSVVTKGSVRFGTTVNILGGNRGYSRSGGRENFGFDSEQILQDFSARIGVWDGIAAVVSVPYVYRNLRSLDAQAFRGSSMYRSRLDGLTSSAARSLVESGICSNSGSCQRLIGARYAPLVDLSMSLPNGERLLLRPGVPVLDALDAAVLGGVAPEQGLDGIGDVSLGFDFEILSMGDPRPKADEESSLPMGLSISPRVTAPTARFEDVPVSRRPAGSGTTMAAVALAFDLGIEKHTVFGLGYEVEKEIATGKRRPSFWADSRKLRQQKSEKYSRTGFGQVVSARLQYDLTGIADWMDGLVAKTSYTFEATTGSSLNGVTKYEGASVQAVGVGLSYNDVVSSIPFSTGFMYTLPVYGSGEDIPVAPWGIAINAEINVRL